MADDAQQKLREFIKRRHPEYDEMLAHWCFVEDTYNGGREWFCQKNIFRYLKEGETEYTQRLERAYRFNHTREVVDLVQKYIFKSPIIRNEDDAPDALQTFWKSATLAGWDINQFAKLVSTLASVFGKIWIVVDSNKPETDAPVSVADAKAAKLRVYAYTVKPQDVLDMGFDEYGALNWIKIRERVRDDKDPINSTGAINEQFRLWTRTDWQLYQVIKQDIGGQPVEEVKLIDSGTHDLKQVPVFSVDHVIGDDKYSAPGLISDIAYLDRACANYLSNLDAIIQDQTFSQLTMPAQGLLPGTDEYKQMLEMGTKRIFVYNGDGGVQPAYISPDAAQANLILVVINKIINEIYHTIGMAGERTKSDNSVGIDNSSGVAKAYDFERMNSLLTSKADSLEDFENKLNTLVLLWNSQAAPADPLVKYPDTFDVRTLFDEFTVASKLATIDAPDELRREQMKQVVDKLFPRLAKDLKDAIETALKSWPPKIVFDLTGRPVVGAPGTSGAPPAGGSPKPANTPPGAPGNTPAAKNPATQKRQGQVTPATPAKK
jgi:hypothetical protein